MPHTALDYYPVSAFYTIAKAKVFGAD